MMSLPICKWRGVVRSNGRFPCTRPGIMTRDGTVAPATCARCELCHTEPMPPALIVRTKQSFLPCIHQGGDTGETVKCLSCHNARLKVFQCGKHGLCTVDKHRRGAGVQDCGTCPDLAMLPASAKIVRNLLYHVYPVSGNGLWQWHIEQLKHRLHLFNGRRIIAIAHSEETQPLLHGDGNPGVDRRMPQATDSPDAVVEALCGHDCEFLVLPNDPARREMQTFFSLMDKVQTLDPAHVTLYAHAKGVTYQPDTWAVQDWVTILYEIYFDYWLEIENQLRQFPMTGAFKIFGQGWPKMQSLADWFYSGSWFWFRNRDLFSRTDWRKADPFWGAVESYPAHHFSAAETGLIFFEGQAGQVNLYRRDTFDSVVGPQWLQWKKQHALLGA